MSSPIANKSRTPIQQALVRFHQLLAHSNRIQKLADAIGTTMGSLFPAGNKPIQALDVGCGDMTVAETIASKHPSIQWTCTDIHELPQHLENTEKWKKYRRFNGSTLPFTDSAFDAVLFSDVLHHCMAQAPDLLREAGRTGRYVIVKDHFESGWISRSKLRLLDFIGNYGYGVSVPDRYFTPESFATTASESGLQIVHMNAKVPIYPGWISPLLPPSLQFIAVMEKSPE